MEVAIAEEKDAATPVEEQDVVNTSAIAADEPEEAPPANDVFGDVTPQMRLAAAIVTRLDEGVKNEVTLSNGIQLFIKGCPPLVIRQAAISVPEPSVPMIKIQRDGIESIEPNPNDPTYLKALNDRFLKQNFIVADAMVVSGTQLKFVPENMDKPEDEDWHERLESVGLEIPLANKYERYLSYMRFYAMAKDSDVELVLSTVIAFSGVTEVEVARAAAAFRRSEEW